MPTESPADAVLKNLERLMARDPLLRDLIDPVLPRARERTRFRPDVDVLEDAASWKVVLEVPGAAREDLAIEIEGTRLVITGSKPSGRGEAKVRVGERTSGRFRREFLLPAEVDPKGIRATLDAGLLTVRLPRVDGARKRSVPIDGEEEAGA